MDLLWLNVIGLSVICFLLFMSTDKCNCPRRKKFRRDRNPSVLDKLVIGSASLISEWRLKARLVPFLLGFSLTILGGQFGLYDFINSWKSRETTLASVYKSNLEHIIAPSNSWKESAGDGPRVWVIMSTKYSLTQPPSLIRIAQAIFPVRHFVTLVVVKHCSVKNGIEHMGDLDRLLGKFSISYVLLSSQKYQRYLKDSRLKLSRGPDSDSTLGRLAGLNWVLSNVNQGVLMMIHEHFTFSFPIFEQIRGTRKVSSWPVAFGRERLFPVGLTSPIISNKSGTVEGYFDGNHVSWDTVPIQLGALAINIDYLRSNGSLNMTWMLASDSEYDIQSLGFVLADVEALGDSCSKIYVWRTETREHAWPVSIMYKDSYQDTNMVTLMKNVFGVKFADYLRAEGGSG